MKKKAFYVFSFTGPSFGPFVENELDNTVGRKKSFIEYFLCQVLPVLRGALPRHHFLPDPPPQVPVLHRQRHHPLHWDLVPVRARLLSAVGLRGEGKSIKKGENYEDTMRLVRLFNNDCVYFPILIACLMHML